MPDGLTPPWEPDLTRRSPAEELWLRRKARGEALDAMAARLGVGRGYLWQAERGGARKGLNGHCRPIPAPGLPLLLRLARRRSGLGLNGVCRALGVSKVTVHKWEANGAPKLIEFWASRGFTFASGKRTNRSESGEPKMVTKPKKRTNGEYYLVTDVGKGVTPQHFYRQSMDGMYKQAQVIANTENETVYLNWQNGKARELVEFFHPKEMAS